ncbi:hypothetical protein U91I_01861 [alpha proteobacterium U9-1i]|nr:hypothetical protein U91I_01861 [alpha proteobacterium U9-1i]
MKNLQGAGADLVPKLAWAPGSTQFDKDGWCCALRLPMLAAEMAGQ